MLGTNCRALICVFGLLISSRAFPAMVTDSTTFDSYSFTYDDAVWGPPKDAREGDAFDPQIKPRETGFGIFFLEPRFRLSSDGSDGPSQLRVTGEVLLKAKPGWELYYTQMAHSGDWRTRGGATVSVEGSFIDISAPNGEFFSDVPELYNEALFSENEDTFGYYFVSGAKSSFKRYDQMRIEYDFNLFLRAPADGDFAQLASDPSEIVLVRDYPQYYDIGTFISAFFYRAQPVPAPGVLSLLMGSLLAMYVNASLAGRRSVGMTRGPGSIAAWNGRCATAFLTFIRATLRRRGGY